jgi:Tol biopolymer transport system component
MHRWPEWLPNGQAVLFAASPSATNWSNAQIAVQVVETGERRNLVQGGTQPRYASSGHLLYAQAGTLIAAPFDLRKVAMRGAATPVLEGVLQSTSAAQYSVSATGTLVYVAGDVEASQRRLTWVSRNGEEQALPAPPHSYQYPRVSPDGRRVAVGIEEQERQVWLYDLARDTLTRLTFEGNENFIPAWTPDGKRVAFRSNRAGGSPNLYWQLADGSGGSERLTTGDYGNSPSSFSPDGQLLAFHEAHPTTGRDIWVLRLSDPGTPGQVHKAQPFLRTQYDEGSPRFSPDGRWLAYSSNESGRYEVYVQPYPGPGGKWQISTEGGGEPLWNPNGRELFYRNGNKMMAVEVTTQPGFTPGKPRLLFEGGYTPSTALSTNYDVSPDGQRFLMLKPVETQTSTPTQINVVLNWFEELKRRVPTR